MSFFLTLRSRANHIQRLHTAGSTAERDAAARSLARDLLAATRAPGAATALSPTQLPPIALPCTIHQLTQHSGN
jgi:hypothetical protein